MNIALLRRLRAAGGDYIPLLDLDLDPLAARRDAEVLAGFGFKIEFHPALGVAYRGPAPRLCPDQIEADLDVAHIGRRIAVWNRVTSTNDLAARAAASTANDGLVILAEEQTAGRGRRGHTWTAPANSSILLSVVLFPPSTTCPTDATWLTALAAVAVAEVVEAATGLTAQIKWPNDVRINGRKISGVLVEHASARGAVLGIGLNVHLERHHFPDELREVATSLTLLKPEGAPFDRSELARSLIQRLDAWYAACLNGRVDELEHTWCQRLELLGQRVDVKLQTAEKTKPAQPFQAPPSTDGYSNTHGRGLHIHTGILELTPPQLELALRLDNGGRLALHRKNIHAIARATDNPPFC
ncbi:MAG: biotin--[acetyl-CoA-carboxylase] ligase [Planctomycetota bacterium]|nr:biotin--[acetyl-CoA-carboxylase] ligase [Planctomycetota bacterium]